MVIILLFHTNDGNNEPKVLLQQSLINIAIFAENITLHNFLLKIKSFPLHNLLNKPMYKNKILQSKQLLQIHL